ncbi:protein ECT2 [Pelomyxa schiedti]|nr:protein ECT2 [Pelomyxa schiedti]
MSSTQQQQQQADAYYYGDAASAAAYGGTDQSSAYYYGDGDAASSTGAAAADANYAAYYGDDPSLYGGAYDTAAVAVAAATTTATTATPTPTAAAAEQPSPLLPPPPPPPQQQQPPQTESVDQSAVDGGDYYGAEEGQAYDGYTPTATATTGAAQATTTRGGATGDYSPSLPEGYEQAPSPPTVTPVAVAAVAAAPLPPPSPLSSVLQMPPPPALVLQPPPPPTPAVQPPPPAPAVQPPPPAPAVQPPPPTPAVQPPPPAPVAQPPPTPVVRAPTIPVAQPAPPAHTDAQVAQQAPLPPVIRHNEELPQAPEPPKGSPIASENGLPTPQTPAEKPNEYKDEYADYAYNFGEFDTAQGYDEYGYPITEAAPVSTSNQPGVQPKLEHTPALKVAPHPDATPTPTAPTPTPPQTPPVAHTLTPAPAPTPTQSSAPSVLTPAPAPTSTSTSTPTPTPAPTVTVPTPLPAAPTVPASNTTPKPLTTDPSHIPATPTQTHPSPTQNNTFAANPATPQVQRIPNSSEASVVNDYGATPDYGTSTAYGDSTQYDPNAGYTDYAPNYGTNDYGYTDYTATSDYTSADASYYELSNEPTVQEPVSPAANKTPAEVAPVSLPSAPPTTAPPPPSAPPTTPPPPSAPPATLPPAAAPPATLPPTAQPPGSPPTGLPPASPPPTLPPAASPPAFTRASVSPIAAATASTNKPFQRSLSVSSVTAVHPMLVQSDLSSQPRRSSAGPFIDTSKDKDEDDKSRPRNLSLSSNSYGTPPGSSPLSSSPLGASPTGTSPLSASPSSANPLGSSITIVESPEDLGTWATSIPEETLQGLIKKRKQIANEILTTETTYVGVLNTVVSKFLDKLNKPHSLGVSKEDVHNLFSNVAVIRDCHARLRDTISGHLNSWSGNSGLGEIFLNMGFLKLYKHYINNFDNSMNTLKICLEKYPEFKAYVSGMEYTPVLLGLNVNGLLITPVQRIPRYVLLLTDLLKSTPEGHPDHDPLKRALESVKALADYINQHRSEADNIAQLTEVQNKIVDLPITLSQQSNAAHRRHFLKDGPMKVNKDKRHLWLFSDILVVTKEIKKDKHKFCNLAHLQTSSLQDIMGEAMSFRLMCTDCVLVFKAQTVAEKDEWKKFIQEKISAAQESLLASAFVDQVASSSEGSKKFLELQEIEHEKKKQALITQFVDTEKEYTSFLDNTLRTFLQPIIHSPSSVDLLAIMAGTLNNGFDKLLANHQSFLSKIPEDTQALDVKIILGHFETVLTLYRTYLSNHTDQLEVLDGTSLKFHNFVVARGLKEKNELKPLLEKPLRRLSEYLLFCQEVVLYINRESPDHAAFSRCLQEMRVITEEFSRKAITSRVIESPLRHSAHLMHTRSTSSLAKITKKP